MDMRKCLCMLLLCLVAGVLRRSDGLKIHKFEMKLPSLEHAKEVAVVLERSGTYDQVLTIKYLESEFCLGKRVILVVSTDDKKYFGDGVKLKDGVRPEVKWTEDALGQKLMSLVMEIKYYSYENEVKDIVGDDGGVMVTNCEEIVGIRLDKMKVGNVSKKEVAVEGEDVANLNCENLKQRCLKTRTRVDCNLYLICMATTTNRTKSIERSKERDEVECSILRDLCKAEEDADKKEIICESAKEVCNYEKTLNNNKN